MPHKIILYGNRYSGHSYKVKLFLALTQTPHEYKTINLTQPRGQRPEPFRSNSKFSEVPLLLMDNRAYIQSNSILLLLSNRLNLMQDTNSQVHTAEWLMWEQSRLGFSLPNLRFEKKFKENTDLAVLSWLENRLRNDLSTLDAHLEAGCDFVLGEIITIVDCSLAGYLYWLSDTGFGINNWPNIGKWLDRISSLKGWKHPNDLLR